MTVLDLLGRDDVERALCLLPLRRQLPRALVESCRTVILAAPDELGLCDAVAAVVAAGPARVSGLLLRAASLPFVAQTFQVVAMPFPESTLQSSRPGLVEAARVLVDGGALILAGIAADADDTGRPTNVAPAIVSVCRLLEEHGFAVDTAVTNTFDADPAAESSRRHVYQAMLSPSVRRQPPVSRDVEFGRYSWPATLIRAVKSPGLPRTAT